MEPKLELAKPRDFGQIINDTFTFAKQNFKPLIKCFFLFCGFFLLAGTIAAVIQQVKMVNELNSINANSSDPYAAASAYSSPYRYLGVSYIITMLMFVLTYVTMLVTVLSYINLYKTNGNTAPGTAEVWAYIKYFYLRALGALLLLVLATAAIIVLFAVLGKGAHDLNVIILGVVACMFLGFWLYPIIAIMFPVMILENTSIWYAFKHSFWLIKENWWRTFGSLFVIGLIVYLCSMILILPTTIANAVGLMLHSQNGIHMSPGLVVATSILQQCCHVFLILPIITAAFCYFNLTEVKEGTAMLDRIKHFGEADMLGTSAGEEQY